MAFIYQRQDKQGVVTLVSHTERIFYVSLYSHPILLRLHDVGVCVCICVRNARLVWSCWTEVGETKTLGSHTISLIGP